jgi:hypothetical protein
MFSLLPRYQGDRESQSRRVRRAFGSGGVERYFGALVSGNRPHQLRWQILNAGHQGGVQGVGVGAVKMHQSQYRGSDVRPACPSPRVVIADDEVAFPMPGL